MDSDDRPEIIRLIIGDSVLTLMAGIAIDRYDRMIAVE